MNDIGEPTVKWLQQRRLYGHRGDALDAFENSRTSRNAGHYAAFEPFEL